MSFSIVSSLIHVLIVVALAPGFVGIIRKSKAFLQGRQGARITQPYLDLNKLFNKDEVHSPDASWVFRHAPYVIFGATAVALSGIPILFAGESGTTGNLFVFVYALAVSTFFTALAGMDTGSSFGGFGSSREMSLSALAEAALVFSFVPLVLASGSGNFGSITSALLGAQPIDFLAVFIAFAAFFIALLSENARVPVDNPTTHLELTMIHEAMILEYSGTRLALIEWASYTKLLGFVILGSNLFFPWGLLTLSATLSARALLIATLILLFKVLLFGSGIALLESVIAKLRIFRVPNLISTAFVLGAVAIALTIV
jgi:formate hydrogenlyase subunit 4